MFDNSSEIDNKLSSFKCFEDVLKSEEKTLVTFVNPYSYPILDRNSNVVKQFNYIYADGALLVRLHNAFNKSKIDRVSFDFSSIAHDVFKFACSQDKTVYFIGGSSSEINCAVDNIKSIYSDLNVVGSHHGFLDSTSKEKLFEELALLNPCIIIVGMGTPLQEHIAIELKNSGVDFNHVFTCGGFITQSASTPDYYLPVVKKLGLRWLQRFVQSPHVRKRVLINYPYFVFKYVFSKFKL